MVLFGLIYFGLSTKNKDQMSLEKSRAGNVESTGIENLLVEARKGTDKNTLDLIQAHLDQYNAADQDSTKIAELIEVSSLWYKAGYPIVSGYYAQEIAEMKNDESAWSIAGTTYMIGMNQATDDKNRLFARNRAIQSLENVVTMNPDDVEAQINLALIYVEYPDENPMQGILMLRELNEKYPDNVGVLNQLAKLALRTNQIDKALERLTTSISIDPSNKTTICLLADAYQLKGDVVKAETFKNKCIN